MNNSPKFVLVGQPNSGKSTLFNVLSDKKASTSNYPGTTISISESQISVGADVLTIVDLPGIYSLNPSDKSEEITYNYLTNNDIDLIINVVDASILSRGLELSIELIEFGLPMVIALNMIDEAESHGIIIDYKLLEEKLGVPIIPVVSLHGKGIKNLIEFCLDFYNNQSYSPQKFNYTYHFEVYIQELSQKIEQLNFKHNSSSRFLAIKAIENPNLLPKDIYSAISDISINMSNKISQEHRLDPFETVSYERHHLSMKLSEDVTKYIERKKRHWIEKIDDILLHPIFGYFVLIIFFFLYFLTIFFVGNFISSVIESPLILLESSFEGLKASSPFLWYTINGAYRGIYGIIGIVLPYFLPLIFLTSLFEDTGYLSRVAFLIDGLMHKIGLHGKSVVPFILGFGCSVPAMYATRMIENQRDRMITGILIPFIPCSARITVIFVLTAAFTGPIWAFIIFAFVTIIVALNGKILSKFLSKPIGLILEIPRLKLPTISNAFAKTWIRLREFLKEAFIFLLLGSILLGWIEYFNVMKYVDLVFAPLVNGIMGLPDQLGSTLIFGFFRKELIIVMMTQALGVNTIADLGTVISTSQIIVFIVFVTLYFPCLTTFVVILKEFGWKVVLLSSVLSVFIATLSAFIFRTIFWFF